MRSPEPPAPPEIRNAGESAFIVEFGNEISRERNARATGLAALLEREPFPGYREAIPTFRSVLVLHDPEADPASIRAHALDCARRAEETPPPEPRRIRIPCVYDGADLPEVARRVGVSEDELVRIHSRREYRVYIIGFTPGFPYLGMADPRLDIPRRKTPRVRVPAGAVALARAQTGIYPWVTPGGWHLVGRTDPALLFDPGKDPPATCLPGDQVRFVPVDELPERHPTPSASPPVGVPAFEVLHGGLLTTVQDLGRPGFQRYGVPWSGAADPPSLRFANRAVGNPDGAAGLECALLGPTLRFLRPTLLALGGADHHAHLAMPRGARWPIPVGMSFLAPEGGVLRFAGPPAGMRAYVAFAGGIDVPETLGSRSTYLTAGFGGFLGRALRPGDRVPLGRPSPAARQNRFEPAALRPPPSGPLRLRISLGPQEDCFPAAALKRLPEMVFTVSNDSNRMGTRLDGPVLRHRPGMQEIVSDANPPGAVQVPPDGRPIVMGADQGTTGGYPKLGAVVAPDRARLAQALPGAEVALEIVSLEKAREIALATSEAPGTTPGFGRPAGRGSPGSDEAARPRESHPPGRKSASAAAPPRPAAPGRPPRRRA